MSAPLFNSKITLNNSSGVDSVTFDLEFTVTDVEGVFSGLDVQVGDVVLLDTSADTPETISRYAITRIDSQDALNVSAEVVFMDSGPPIDPGIAIFSDGMIGRPAPNTGVLWIPSPSQQVLPQKFLDYARNYDFVKIVDPSFVTGPDVSTDSGIAVYDGTTGHKLKNSDLVLSEASVETTDDTVTPAQTISIPVSAMALIETRVVAMVTDGDNIGYGAAYVRMARIHRTEGGVTLSPVQTTYTNEDDPSWDATLIASGGNCLVQVQGPLTSTVSWNVSTIIRVVT